MAAYHKKLSAKIIPDSKIPDSKKVVQKGDPDSFYKLRPSWAFASSDTSSWPITETNTGPFFWNEIFPRMQNLETQTWGEILVTNKKQNHSINVEALNKCARDRLAERMIEYEAIYSLRITGKHRLYGYIIGSTFNLLWFDDDHGDNDNCVCRSYKDKSDKRK